MNGKCEICCHYKASKDNLCRTCYGMIQEVKRDPQFYSKALQEYAKGNKEAAIGLLK